MNTKRAQCRYTVVYDGSCRVCDGFATRLRRRDGGRLLEIIPSQTAGLRARFPWILEHAYRESLQLIGPDGETWQGAQAIERLLTILPRGRGIAWLFHVPLARKLADRFYCWFGRNRYRLGCIRHCRPHAANAEGVAANPAGAEPVQ